MKPVYTFIRLMHKNGYAWIHYTLRSPKVVVVEYYNARPGGRRRRTWRKVVSKQRANDHIKLMVEAYDFHISYRDSK